MFETIETIDAPSGARLALRSLLASGPARGVILIQHGLAEHSGRYGRFAQDLSEAGFHALCHDHRGHGATRAPDAPPRRFAAHDGVDAVLADSQHVRELARQRFGPLAQIIFGHSMGGLIAMSLAMRHGAGLAGLCLWNCNLDIGPQERLAGVALRVEQALKGSDAASLVLRRATFDSWRRSVSPRHGDFDWLSHDGQAVAAYEADPLCGWTPTNSMARDLLAMVLRGGDKANMAQLAPTLPVHLLGGGADPATRNGQALRRLARSLAGAGLGDVELDVLAGARHETLQETPRYRAPAMRSLIDWLQRVAPPHATGQPD